MAVSLFSFTPNTKIESSKVNTNFTNLSDHIRPTFVFTVDEVLTTGTSKTPVLIVPQNLTIDTMWAYAKTAPQGASIICDVNVNGTSIWASNQGNRITIAAGSNQDSTQTFDTVSLSQGDILTLDIDQVGSTTSGESLTIAMKCN